jgi:hypothetical protein
MPKTAGSFMPKNDKSLLLHKRPEDFEPNAARSMAGFGQAIRITLLPLEPHCG